VFPNIILCHDDYRISIDFPKMSTRMSHAAWHCISEEQTWRSKNLYWCNNACGFWLSPWTLNMICQHGSIQRIFSCKCHFFISLLI
jgi:hypothetical protein